MSELDAARDRFVAEHRAFADSRRGEPSWLAAHRRAALAAFASRGLPSTREEEWRYTNLAPFAAVPFALAEPARVSRADLEELATPLFACSLYAFANGRAEPALSSPPGLPGGARCDSLAALFADGASPIEAHLDHCVDLKLHPFAALNSAFASDGAVVRAPRGVAFEQPVHLVFASVTDERPQMTHPRVAVVAEAGSRVTIVQDHVSTGSGPGFTNAVTEVHVGAGATVHWVLLQREHDAHFHVANLAVRQERDSTFTAHTLTLGGCLVRNDAGVLLAGEGAHCTLDGLFVGGGASVLDNHTEIDHAVPHGTSRELYKGVLGGAARGVFRGRVIVRPDAQKTSASQSNANLLLGARAEIDTKPQLEIYADDVKCSHGSTIGRLDENALFYLRSRGLPEARARDLLLRAFALEVLERLPARALAQGLDDAVVACLRRARGEAR
ncbi:MAG TPA: Fe-S cluster assembly protein SufD [Myxococcota bacterium]|nr:Fe-S cluster assembly protein SufD [Myxococcota bacterium]